VQTLKTAAIVVLLMTVMYGAYVSLTTPPEPPAEIQDVLEFHQGTLAIDAGLPDTLGGLDINMGTAATDSVTGLTDSTGNSFVDLADPGFSGSVAGIVESQDSGVTAILSDGSPLDYVDEPRPEQIAAANVPVGKSYPNTGDTFDLPDPNNISTDFVPSGVIMNDLPEGELALTGGVSDSQSFGAPLSGQDTPPDTTRSSGATNLGLANAIRIADQQYAEDKRADALSTLSIFYNVSNLSGEQRSELLSRLDPLARDVIYSQRHLLEQAHRVGQNETLIDIASRYNVPWQLLANINHIKDPITVLPGTELKVVRGPFRAEVNLSLKELTLFLGDLYAGRFSIGIGNDPPPKPGTFTVQDKQTVRTYYDSVGSPIPPGSPANPYGNAWIDLGGQLCIHGSPSTTSPTDKGCISLAADYADDLYGILSQGSSVTIRR
jgi:lipoprotein-anchoring transpeptidase ErfK/SrfK